jgi:hypothetical protein
MRILITLGVIGLILIMTGGVLLLPFIALKTEKMEKEDVE